jgi:hypothetical protein
MPVSADFTTAGLRALVPDLLAVRNWLQMPVPGFNAAKLSEQILML